jgi:5-methylcytosine-specific restriction endonuclease McrA
MVVHHITPRRIGGGDNYENLILVTPDVHWLIHATKEETVRKYLNKLKSCKLNMARLNKLRELAGNCKIVNR